MKKLISILILISGCGFNGVEKVQTNDSTQVISIEFGFLNQIETLCSQQVLSSAYATNELYNQAVANCVFSNLTILNAAQLSNLENNYCKPNADLSSFTASQIATIQASCAAVSTSTQSN